MLAVAACPDAHCTDWLSPTRRLLVDWVTCFDIKAGTLHLHTPWTVLLLPNLLPSGHTRGTQQEEQMVDEVLEGSRNLLPLSLVYFQSSNSPFQRGHVGGRNNNPGRWRVESDSCRGPFVGSPRTQCSFLHGRTNPALPSFVLSLLKFTFDGGLCSQLHAKVSSNLIYKTRKWKTNIKRETSLN